MGISKCDMMGCAHAVMAQQVCASSECLRVVQGRHAGWTRTRIDWDMTSWCGELDFFWVKWRHSSLILAVN